MIVNTPSLSQPLPSSRKMVTPSVEEFLSTVPEKWSKAVKPIIIKAVEFEKAKQPLVSYYLQTYAIFRCMALHKAMTDKTEKATTTPYLMSFLNHLEKMKEDPSLSKLIEESDGRTVLTKTALQLFTKADDAERSGQVSEAVVKLFFTSTILFEATKQYIEDATMDPICTEKHKYASYVAVLMKKALASKQPYISPNGATEAQAAPQFEEEEFPIHAPSAPVVPTTNNGYHPPETNKFSAPPQVVPPPVSPPPQQTSQHQYPAPPQQYPPQQQPPHHQPDLSQAPGVASMNSYNQQQLQYANAPTPNGGAAPGGAAPTAFRCSCCVY